MSVIPSLVILTALAGGAYYVYSRQSDSPVAVEKTPPAGLIIPVDIPAFNKPAHTYPNPWGIGTHSVSSGDLFGRNLDPHLNNLVGNGAWRL